MPALYFTPSTLATRVSEREHSRSMLSGPKRQPLAKYRLWNVYKHQSYARSCSFKTSARSSQTASLPFSDQQYHYDPFTPSSSRPWIGLLFPPTPSPICTQHVSIIVIAFIHHLLHVRCPPPPRSQKTHTEFP